MTPSFPSWFSPMLANNKEYNLTQDVLTKHRLTDYLVSEKLDGIRCLVTSEGICSREFKPIPNRYINAVLQRTECKHMPSDIIFDGELLTYSDEDLLVPETFHEIQSRVMSEDGEPRFLFNVFDLLDVTAPLTRAERRNEELCTLNIHNIHADYTRNVDSVRVYSIEELDALHDATIKSGGEGLMLRHRDSKYKFGRATLREASLLKYVRYARATCKIIGFNEAMENLDTSCKRQENLVPKGYLGALRVQCVDDSCPFNGTQFNVGSGFNRALAMEIWQNSSKYEGKLVDVKYKPCGSKDAPRQGIFVGFREDITVC